MPRKLKHVQPGDRITADLYNTLVDRVNWLDNLSVDGSIELFKYRGGVHLHGRVPSSNSIPSVVMIVPASTTYSGSGTIYIKGGSMSDYSAYQDNPPNVTYNATTGVWTFNHSSGYKLYEIEWAVTGGASLLNSQVDTFTIDVKYDASGGGSPSTSASGGSQGLTVGPGYNNLSTIWCDDCAADACIHAANAGETMALGITRTAGSDSIDFTGTIVLTLLRGEP